VRPSVARLKLKGIDGGPHKRWSMWFNSTQREEPYLGSNGFGKLVEILVLQQWIGVEVLHGCRQLVS